MKKGQLGTKTRTNKIKSQEITTNKKLKYI